MRAHAVADVDALFLRKLEMLIDQPRPAAGGFHGEPAPELELAVDQIGLPPLSSFGARSIISTLAPFSRAASAAQNAALPAPTTTTSHCLPAKSILRHLLVGCLNHE